MRLVLLVLLGSCATPRASLAERLAEFSLIRDDPPTIVIEDDACAMTAIRGRTVCVIRLQTKHEAADGWFIDGELRPDRELIECGGHVIACGSTFTCECIAADERLK